MISIIIPCFNKSQYLKDCIGSITLNITSLKYEIIVVDDYSSDDSYNEAQLLGCQVIRNEKNLKLPTTRNKAIESCNGDFIICLDADDKIPDNYIQANYDNLIYNKVDISYSNSQCFGSSDKLYNWPPFEIGRMLQSPFIHCASMFRKEVWEVVGGYDESMVDGWEDYDFWMMAYEKGFKFKKCDTTYLLYRRGDSQFSQVHNDKDIKLQKIREYLKQKHQDLLGRSR